MAEVVARITVQIGEQPAREVAVVEGDSPGEVFSRVGSAFSQLAIEQRLAEVQLAFARFVEADDHGVSVDFDASSEVEKGEA